MTGEGEEEEDIISLLPDCLLLEIISRLDLSTVQVIKTTSTISKRWQHLWTKLPTLNFTWTADDIAPNDIDLSDYFSFIDKTLAQCPTHFNLTKFELLIINNTSVYTQPKSPVYSWIQHAITRNVQELHLIIDPRYWKYFSYDHELFFNNSSLVSMTLGHCAFTTPNGAIRWDNLKCLCIHYGKLDEDIMGKILSGSPCLETLEFDVYYFYGSLSKPLFENFSVERLSCCMETYERCTEHEGFWDGLFDLLRMKLSLCVSNPPNGWGNLNFLCIQHTDLYEDSIGKILSGSPCLETLVFYCCNGVRRIDIASNSVKNLVFSDYSCYGRGYVLEIDAPRILSLTIKGDLDVEKILLLNISSLVKAELDYVATNYLAEKRGRTLEDIEDELLKGILTNLGHVNEVTLRNNCLEVSSRLKKKKKKRGSHRVHFNCCHRFYLFIIILLFGFCLAMVSNRSFGLLIY